MPTLLLDRADLDVRYVGGALALYENGQRSGTVPIKLLDRVVIQGARTHLDTSVLLKLAEAGVSTLLLSPRAARQVAIILGLRHNDAAIRLAQSQRVVDAAYCNRWAAALVAAKLQRQIRVLSKAELIRPDQRKALFDARALLTQSLTQLAENRTFSTASLRGLEGSAARAYFAGYRSLFASALNFTGRNRRPPRDPVNVCLSLSYTLLHFEAVHAAHAAGLDPLLGFYHRPAFGRESLASDLIEPLRPWVDEWVWGQFRNGNLRAEHFSSGPAGCVMGKAGRGHFYPSWERFAGLPRRWLRKNCSRLARSLRQEGEPWLERLGHEDEDEG